MSTIGLPESLITIARRGAIRTEDVQQVRRTVYRDGELSYMDAEWVLNLDGACRIKAPEWTPFFAEALVDYIVHQTEPEGMISDDKAAWLIDRLAVAGVVRTTAGLEALIKVLEAARSAPAPVAALALDQVRLGVMNGEGPLANRPDFRPGVIGEAEVALLRRVLYAFGGGGNIAVTRAEAEVLFDLNDASREAENHPAWSDLFVKALANYLMGARGYRVPSRAEALRQEAWLAEESAGVLGDMLSGLLRGSLKEVWSAYRRDEEAKPAGPALLSTAEAVSAEKVAWLANRIGRDGVIHGNERALIDFLREEDPDIHPSLRTLVDSAA